jgi:hypothetical protein
MKTPEQILLEIQTIETMERGTLCKIKGGAYFNHQTWREGRNHVRYVAHGAVPALRDAIAGYRRFRRLTEEYAEAIILRSRAARTASPPSQRPRRRKI